MARDELLNMLRCALPQLMARYGVLHLDLFGSFARGEAGPESDVDFLVTYLDEPTFDSYMGLKEELESLLNRRVDLVTLHGLKARIRDSVLAELHRVA
jgi:predicted nucleotidyltransferase